MTSKRRKPILLAAVVIVFATLFILLPETSWKSVQLSAKYGREMLLIFPSILILMGLADVWIPKEAINRYLGYKSGLKGVGLSIILGTLPTGPLYIAFPIAAELLRKQASVMNVIIFLGVWASLKIPQIGVEIQFLGLSFALWRFLLTLASVVLIGFIIGQVTRKEVASSVQLDEQG